MTTNFFHDQYEKWFARACRQSELIAGIEAWAEAPLSRETWRRTTPAQALKEIRRLLAEYDAERAAERDGGDRP